MANHIRIAQRTPRILFAICSLIFCALTASTCLPIPAHATTIHSIAGNNTPAPDSKLGLTYENCQTTWSKDVEGTVIYEPTEDSWIWCLKLASKTKATSYANPVSLTFVDAGEVAGRPIDVIVDVTELRVGAKQGASSKEDTSTNYIGIMVNAENAHWFGCSSSGYSLVATKDFDIRVSVVWSDTQEEIGSDLFLGISDLDAPLSATTTYYRESVVCKAGFTQEFWTWADCAIPHATDSKSGYTTWKSNYTGNVSGAQSFTVAGCLATIAGSSFTATFNEGNCATGLQIYLPDGLVQDPIKTANISDLPDADLGQKTITWTIEQTVGVFAVDTIEGYSSLEFNDPIPSGFAISSADLIAPNGSTACHFDTDSKTPSESSEAVLEVSNDGSLVYAALDSSLLEQPSFYDGGTWKLIIAAELVDVNALDVDTGLITNTATVSIDGFEREASVSTPFYLSPDLKVTKEPVEPAYAPGETSEWIVTVSQTRKGAQAHSLECYDAVQNGLDPTSVSFSELSDNRLYVEGNSVYLDGVLNYGESISFKVSAKVRDNAKELVSNNVLVSSNAPERVKANATAKVLKPALELRKNASKKKAAIGSTVSWTIQVTESTRSCTAEDVVLTDLLPDGLIAEGCLVLQIDDATYEMEPPIGADCSLELELGDITYGHPATITLLTRIGEERDPSIPIEEYEEADSLLPESILNTAKATSSNAGQASDSDEVALLPRPFAKFKVNEFTIVGSKGDSDD